MSERLHQRVHTMTATASASASMRLMVLTIFHNLHNIWIATAVILARLPTLPQQMCLALKAALRTRLIAFLAEAPVID